MRTTLGRWATPLLLALALAVPALPEDPPSPEPPVFPTELEEVHVTVAVDDQAGKPLRNLREEDFRIYENGRPQRIQLFGRAHDPGRDDVLSLDLGLLMDTSTSMLNELKLSQQAAVRFLESIPRARDLLTIFFDDDIRLSRYDSENQQGLYDRILKAKGGGNTALYDAISVYLSRVQEASGRKVLVLFTDGEDSRSAISLTDALELVRASGVVIYPIAFGGSAPPGSTRALQSRRILVQMAEVTGGQVFAPRSHRDLGAIYARILLELQSQYVLGFVSDDSRRDGKYRRLKVEVAGRTLRIRHRAGYYPE